MMVRDVLETCPLYCWEDGWMGEWVNGGWLDGTVGGMDGWKRCLGVSAPSQGLPLVYGVSLSLALGSVDYQIR